MFPAEPVKFFLTKSLYFNNLIQKLCQTKQRKARYGIYG